MVSDQVNNCLALLFFFQRGLRQDSALWQEYNVKVIAYLIKFSKQLKLEKYPRFQRTLQECAPDVWSSSEEVPLLKNPITS